MYILIFLGFVITLILIMVIGIIVYKSAETINSPKQATNIPKQNSQYNYKKRHTIMTQNEVNFFRTLSAAVGTRYYIFPQIHLSALLDHTVRGQSWKGAFSHINGKSVDYILCEPSSLSPIVAIELDDKTHAHEDRVKRDIEVERILSEVSIPLVRFEKPWLLSPEEVAKQIENALS